MSAVISPQSLAGLRARGENVSLIDVRTPAEFAEVHIDFASNFPLERLDAKEVASWAGKDGGTLYVVCRSGSRGRQACEKLAAAGLNVVNVEGGTNAWVQAGLPVLRGRKTISLERQVRIAAGFLVVASSLLAMFVHPYFAGLAAFVGGGLMFAGITDTCGMAMALARMPWNQAAGSSGGQACKA